MQLATAHDLTAYPVSRASRTAPGTEYGSGRTIRDYIDTVGDEIRLQRNQPLFQDGDLTDRIYCVDSGLLRSCKLLSDGRRQIGAFPGAGDLLLAFSGPRHGFTVEAVAAATVRSVSRKAVEALSSGNSAISREMLKITLGELTLVQNRLMLLGRKSAEERLASFLLEMLERFGDGDRVRLPMPRADIADYLGLTIETVSRTFTLFRHEGLVELPSAQLVVIADLCALEETSGAD